MPSFTIEHDDLQNIPVNDKERMRSTQFVDEKLVDELWQEKSRMDYLYDNNKGYLYTKERDRQFPQDKRGSLNFSNRAGDKLWQIHDSTPGNLFTCLNKGCAFYDLCGGPGAFSELLLSNFDEFSKGFGITLKVAMTRDNKYWYSSLEKNDKFHISWGQTNDGDIYVPENLEFVLKEIKDFPIQVVVSDGGFKIQKIGDDHMENYQELFSGRIILSEFTWMIKMLQPGGHFVCKLFDSFSNLTISLIYLATKIFDNVYIVKPLKSRIVNSERYLACKCLKKSGPILDFYKNILSQLHSQLYKLHNENSGINLSPLSVVPIEMMTNDSQFFNSIFGMNLDLCSKQTRALKSIMDTIYDINENSEEERLESEQQRLEFEKREKRKKRFFSN